MTIYLIDDSKALIGPIELPVVPGVGEQTPGNAISLPAKLVEPLAGFSWALIDKEPQQLEDHRGLMYRISDGGKEVWNSLGSVPERLTPTPWPGKYYVWQEDKWVIDEGAKRLALTSAAQAARDQRLQEAATRIAPLQYAEDLKEITETEKASLLHWKRYSIELNRIEQTLEYPFHINWPEAPPDALVR
ncbi:tail fiber assembly protein [Pseudomonas viridiflava]|uniref:tail fiber assembly protein n=1 Tax=Pseudomonas viridiflava TaxID=33069 RepID=UPI000474185E|nr:tail fiber assembly protein [Pseudomonas viridiflava]